jgi:uncharacterized ParB-like nuclease family protein
MGLRILICGLLLIALVIGGLSAHAQYPENGQWQRHEARHEMMAACSGKTPGMACSFLSEGRAVGGTCHPTRRGQLVCLSSGGMPPYGMGGPATGMPGYGGSPRHEMMAACDGKTPGTACSFLSEGRAVGGTCHPTRQGQLVCLSSGGMPPYGMSAPPTGTPWYGGPRY